MTKQMLPTQGSLLQMPASQTMLFAVWLKEWFQALAPVSRTYCRDHHGSPPQSYTPAAQGIRTLTDDQHLGIRSLHSAQCCGWLS